ncbi:hypothetical protein BG015_008736 [Linnemannia schmuckeri]|uniref:Uncharacterized protein n=1 Tax=Linnemannia schmuckeri TaxID=64567 RepID=A0A9P5VAA2_9FUNG|nr:hypothetical protein BG015_008736 [Linnemannia schmuckeri]
MKLIITLLATVAVVNAYTCPANPAITTACRAISVFPLTCSNPNVNVAACNEKQCTQPYIDNYAACQCRRSPTLFYEHSVNVEGLLRRCGVAGLTNPFGNPYQYRPGQGTQTFAPSGGSGTAGAPGSGEATRVFSGTTYYGGSTSVISGTTRIVDATAVVNNTRIASGTTTWVSNTPGIVQGTSTPWVGVATTSAAPIEAPSATAQPIVEQNNHMSGGAIAGTVLGSLAAIALAGLLGWCWRKKRAQHTTLYSNPAAAGADPHTARAPTRTVVTEKIEPVVVKSVPTSNTHVVGPGTTNYSTSANNYNTNNTSTGYNSNTYGSASNPNSTAHTAYNTTTNSGYNTHPRTSNGGALDSVSNGVHNTTNATGNAVGSGVNIGGHGFNSTGNTVGSGVNSVGNGIRGTSNSTSNTMH